jgi:indole-3-glycerol phosphate synthase
MTPVVPTILERIVVHKRRELAAVLDTLPEIEAQAENSIRERRDFAQALRAAPPAIIAELKRASPSRGVLLADYQPSRIASAYQKGGAAALSVLTDTEFFLGSLADLAECRASTSIPVLRKDFTIHRFHVLEAAANGADAILLIAAILSDTELRDLRELAKVYGMSALVEVHDRMELERAAASGAHIIGVNNRDLRTFEVRLETSLELAEGIPPGTTCVAESGIRSADDIRRLSSAGYHAFLVGEHLMTSTDPAAAIRDLGA